MTIAINTRHPRSSRCTAILAIFVVWTLLTSPVARAQTTLSLLDLPSAAAQPLASNILVGIDNSGSMDFETLFDRERVPGLTDGGNLNAGGKEIVYLFPNGTNECSQVSATSANCASYDRRIYPDSSYVAAPPVPDFGYTRAPSYNTAHFDPGETYRPWPSSNSRTFGNVDPANAPSDPLRGSSRFDLTKPRRLRGANETFFVPTGTTLPKGTVAYLSNCVFIFCSSDWTTLEQDRTVQRSDYLPIEYFPATFYLDQSRGLPNGWKATGRTLIGRDPGNNRTLYRYEIRRDNFIDGDAGQSAYVRTLQNFANWFSYYRKRSLAIRGAATAAFSPINGVRVHACTISNSANCLAADQTLSSLSADSASTRKTFYDSIYDMSFSAMRDTPNRPTLNNLGSLFETHPNIIQSACQRNYALLFTDGFNSAAVSGIGNVDGKYASSTSSPVPDDYANTIADVAMRYYREFQPPPGIPNAPVLPLPVGCPGDPSADCIARPHVNTFGVTLGTDGFIFGNQSRYGPENTNPYNARPPWYIDGSGGRLASGTLATGRAWEIDDLWHATINSHGALINADSPQTLAASFSTLLSDILSRGGATSNATGSGSRLAQGSAIYQTQYQTRYWQGDLVKLDARSAGTTTDGTVWHAADLLPGYNASSSSDTRQIITAVTNAAGTGITGRAFRADGSLTGAYPTLTASAVAYLRGDRSQETSTSGQGSFRQRDDTVLGDIVNSVPVYVGAPDPLRYIGPWNDRRYPNASPAENGGQSYSGSASFASTNANRVPLVYVGANDGMLHAFDAQTGQERFAFVPRAVLPRLANAGGLTDPAYSHRAYVDGQITVSPVFYANTWHTSLVGALRNGGRAIYALDVTTPPATGQAESRAGSLIRWEFTDAELGQTFGKPAIVRLHTGRWAAIFANGYNSTSGGAALFIVDIETGALIRRLDTGARPTTASAPGNGLGSPTTTDIDGDRIADYVYAGDLYGNVWRFDLTNQQASEWSSERLFKAQRDGATQPITAAPAVATHPLGPSFGAMIYVGTGQNITLSTSNSAAPANSVYGLWDAAVFTYDASVEAVPQRPTATIERGALVTQQFTATGQQSNSGLELRRISDNSIAFTQLAGPEGNTPIVDRRGWSIDLPAGGEAVIEPPRVIDDTLEFATVIVTSQDCRTTSSGYFNVVDRTNGGRPARLIFDLNGDARINELDDVDTAGPIASIGFGAGGASGAGAEFLDPDNATRVLKLPLSGGSTATITLSSGGYTGRRTWHEIRE